MSVQDHIPPCSPSPSSSSSSPPLHSPNHQHYHRQRHSPLDTRITATANASCSESTSSNTSTHSSSPSPASSATSSLSGSSPMTEIFIPQEDINTLYSRHPAGPAAGASIRDPAPDVFHPTLDGWTDFSINTGIADTTSTNTSLGHSANMPIDSSINSSLSTGMTFSIDSNSIVNNANSSCASAASTRPLPKVIQGRSRGPSSPPISQPMSRNNRVADRPPLPPAPSPASVPHSLSIPPPSVAVSTYLPPSTSTYNAIPHSPTSLRRTSVSDSFSSFLMAKKTRDTSNLNITTAPTSRDIVANSTTSIVKAGDEVMDIESCIDNPILAPLGRHVHKRRSPKRVDKGHVDINVVRPSSPASFMHDQERESHAPVTSLSLRRRRLDCAQLEHYLQNLQPTLDPYTMCTLQSPLLHLTELDLSRNRLESLPENMTSLVPFLSYLNLSHNQFTEIPLELCRLTYLQVLIMSQNRIEGPVPHQVCSSLTQLKTLRLCANQITSLPQSLARLDKLESLSMGSVYGGNLLATFPANCIQYMPALREIDLSHNKLCFLPADIGHPYSHLRQLTASDNKLEAIPKSIGLCRELRSLNLGRNQLTSLPTEIADLKQLDTLDLSENLLCVIPGDVADFLTKTTLLLTGNPFTRGYCDANRNPISEIGGLGITHPPDEDRYAAVLKSLSRRAILNSAASSSSGTHSPTMASFTPGFGGGGRESPRLGPAVEGSSYEMDQDERLDYHLYYTRHALSSRPPSRAESVSSLNEAGGTASDYGGSYGGSWNDPYGAGTGPSTPRVNVEAVLSDIDSFFEYIPSLNNSSTNIMTTTTISSITTMAEPSIFDGTSLSLASSRSPTPVPTPQMLSPGAGQGQEPGSPLAELSSRTSLVSSLLGVRPATTSCPSFFPSLKELAARAVLHSGEPLPMEYIPEAVVEYLQPGARPCGLCRRPYVKEWVSSVRVKSYLGHPAVARRVRFCSAACWKAAGEQLELEESGKVVASNLIPGATTGHLPPVVVTSDCMRSMDDDLNLDGLDSGLPSPTTPLTPSQQQLPWTPGMRVCKGGQTYWPVIGRQRRGRAFSSGSSGSSLASSPSSSAVAGMRNLVGGSSSSSSSIAKTNVCSGGCLGGGVCEW